MALAVEFQGVHIRQPGLPGRRLGVAQDRRRDVGGQHVAVHADAARGNQGLFARASRHVEHARTRADRRHVQHGLGRRAQPARQQGSPSVPGLGGVLPLRTRGLAELLGIENGRCNGCENEGFSHGSAPWI